MLHLLLHCYVENLGVWAWPNLGNPLSKVIQQSNFLSLATSPASANGLWSELSEKEMKTKLPKKQKEALSNTYEANLVAVAADVAADVVAAFNAAVADIALEPMPQVG